MTPETLARWVKDPAARPRYLEAFGRSDFDAMLNYYKMWVIETDSSAAVVERPQIQSPVLVFHGLADTTVTSDTLSGTWDRVARDLTLVTIPGAGHFVQQDAADLVTSIAAVVAHDAISETLSARESISLTAIVRDRGCRGAASVFRAG